MSSKLYYDAICELDRKIQYLFVFLGELDINEEEFNKYIDEHMIFTVQYVDLFHSCNDAFKYHLLENNYISPLLVDDYLLSEVIYVNTKVEYNDEHKEMIKEFYCNFFKENEYIKVIMAPNDLKKYLSTKTFTHTYVKDNTTYIIKIYDKYLKIHNVETKNDIKYNVGINTIHNILMKFYKSGSNTLFTQRTMTMSPMEFNSFHSCKIFGDMIARLVKDLYLFNTYSDNYNNIIPTVFINYMKFLPSNAVDTLAFLNVVSKDNKVNCAYVDKHMKVGIVNNIISEVEIKIQNFKTYFGIDKKTPSIKRKGSIKRYTNALTK